VAEHSPKERSSGVAMGGEEYELRIEEVDADMARDEDDDNNSPGEMGSPGKSYNSIPTQDLPGSPGQKSTMFAKRKSQDIAWEDLNFTVNKEVHVLRNVWGMNPSFPSFIL
jgi:hypothetical protein